ncbi:uncharacterized protein [Venturia canescens]|uniref:uncharacterized protein n=1 Tax=Venturia canescens TaxID=32260 RepID=UPI001C9D2719|nr:uncharacterized protein LOC122415182 [Venturia canescens]
MIVANIYKNLCRPRILSHYGRSLANLCNVSSRIFTPKCKSTTIRNMDRIFFSPYKNYSTESEAKPEAVALPPISGFPPSLWPKIFTTLKNYFIINMVIKSKIDKEFNEDDFVCATKQALLVISRALASEDYDQLNGLVTVDVIDTLRNNISRLNYEQKKCIAVQEGDIYLSFPSSVSIEEENDRKVVEIGVVHHYMQGFGLMKDQAVTLNSLSAYQDRIYIANYRFHRDYSEGSEASWIVNAVNHFSPQLAYQYQQN